MAYAKISLPATVSRNDIQKYLKTFDKNDKSVIILYVVYETLFPQYRGKYDPISFIFHNYYRISF